MHEERALNSFYEYYLKFEEVCKQFQSIASSMILQPSNRCGLKADEL
jgi:hypothetical protein